MAAEFCRLTQEREPRFLGFHIYVTEDGSSEVVVQIHPDAESMQHHIEVMGDKVRETFAYADFESLEIYGEPNEELKEWSLALLRESVHSSPGALGRLHPAQRT